MIDVRLLRTDLDGVRAATARRGDPALLDQVDAASVLDERLREITARRDELRANVNELSRQVGQLRRTGDVAVAEERQAESRQLGEEEKELADEHDKVAEALRDVLLVLPNLIHPDAPDGASDARQPGRPRPVAACPRRSPSTSAGRTGRSVPSSGSSTTSGRSRSVGRCSP